MQIVVLAAGKGTRMKSELPKVLIPIKEKPILVHLVSAIIESGVDQSPIIVVSPENKEQIAEALKNFDCQYAVQEEQLGTGHALACAKDFINNEHVVCLYGDHPFLKPETIKKLADNCHGTITIITTTVDDYEGFGKNFYQWGRIVRENGKISAITEMKDADEETRQIKEINPALYCFDTAWLWENIDKLKNNNVQSEYYLTDLIKAAFDQGKEINSMNIELKEAMGINSLEELHNAEEISE